MMPIDAFHLPGLEECDVDRWETRDYDDGVCLRWPVLSPEGLGRVTARLRTARAAKLAGTPVADLLDRLDGAAARFSRADDPCRALAERALPAITGYSRPMIRLGLDRMVPTWRKDALRVLLEAELGEPRVLDAFQPHPRVVGLRRRAYGPELAFHIFAGNVPGVAVTSLVRSLVVKAATLGKTAADEPLLPALFARALAETARELADCLAVTYWSGGTPALEEVALGAADAVVVYGGQDTVSSIREQLPQGMRLVVHGPRVSFGLVGRGALGRDEAARAAATVAHAAAAFDQQGCVSPHVIYVERGGETAPDRFAGFLGAAMAEVEREIPRGRIGRAEAAHIQQLRGAAEFRAVAGQDVRLFVAPGTEYTVVYDPDPAFTASCLNRFVWVKPLDDLLHVPAYVHPYSTVMQTVAIAGAGSRLGELAEQLGRVGVSRITDFDRMAWPPASWHHDGAEPLGELVRWVDLEE